MIFHPYSKAHFSLPPDFDVVEKVIRNYQDLKSTKIPEADAVVVFSCAGRQVAVAPMIQQEIKGLKNIRHVPMAGFFSNAELAQGDGGNL
jgi:small ligand-binding sensory domain FIST